MNLKIVFVFSLILNKIYLSKRILNNLDGILQFISKHLKLNVFLNEIKHSGFIHQFEDPNNNFCAKSFIHKLEERIKSENISITTDKKTLELLERIVKELLENCFEGFEAPADLIVVYIISSILKVNGFYKGNKEQNVKMKLPPLSREGVKIAKRYKLPLISAISVDLALKPFEASNDPVIDKFNKRFREIIINGIITNELFYKTKEKVIAEVPNGYTNLLNTDWDRTIRKFKYSLDNEARKIAWSWKDKDSFVIGFTHPNGCSKCKTAINMKVFRVSEIPQLPYLNCTSEICRCLFLQFDPEFQWIDKNNKVRLKVENPREWQKWIKKLSKDF